MKQSENQAAKVQHSKAIKCRGDRLLLQLLLVRFSQLPEVTDVSVQVVLVLSMPRSAIENILTTFAHSDLPSF